MPTYPGAPYAEGPFYCFLTAEICVYILFLLCLKHAVNQGIRHVSYLLGGLAFGLMLEYVNVTSNLGYTYGKFAVMFGRAPDDIPLWIGIGWSVIMYTARLFSDSRGLPLWSAAALDALLAITIDISMDTVAYRLHMWNWDWNSKGLDPLTADWFGVPFGNFFGWLLVVFFYSSISRLLEKRFFPNTTSSMGFVLVPLVSVVFSEILLYIMLVPANVFLKQFGITWLHRFVSLLLVLLVIMLRGIRKSKSAPGTLPSIVWLVPLWFHIYFFAWLFIGGFYIESKWLVITAIFNFVLGTGIHLWHFKKKAEIHTVAKGAFNV